MFFMVGCGGPNDIDESLRNLDYCNPDAPDPAVYCEDNEHCVASISKCRQICRPDARTCRLEDRDFDCMCPARQFCQQDGDSGSFYCTDELTIECDSSLDCQNSVVDRSFCGDFVCSGGRCLVVFDSGLQTGVACDDKNPCTLDDKCNAKGYCLGVTKLCDEYSGQCTVGVCEDGECRSSNRVDGLACSDGQFCTTLDMCSEGICVGQAIPPCQTSAQCQVAVCHEADEHGPAGCESGPIDNGTVCDDLVGCTTNDSCYEGKCGGKPDDALCEPMEGHTVICSREQGCVYQEIPVPEDAIERDSTNGDDVVVDGDSEVDLGA